MNPCDDQPVPKPATGKTPVRNARIGDEVWLPALARAEVLGQSGTDAVDAGLRWFGALPLPAAYELTFANWPEAQDWATRRGDAFAALVADLAEASVIIPDAAWLAVAAWIAAKHHPADPDQQKRVLAGHIMRRVTDDETLRDRYRDSRHLSETVQAILAAHLPLAGD